MELTARLLQRALNRLPPVNEVKGDVFKVRLAPPAEVSSARIYQPELTVSYITVVFEKSDDGTEWVLRSLP